MAKTLKADSLEYTGKKQPKPGELDKNGRPLSPYLPASELVDAVNLAIRLEKPLLIKGEPGSGKTRLARAVAYELGLIDDYFESWYVKSTSRARDGLYTYDAVGRLRDAQLEAANRLSAKESKLAKDPMTYLHWGPLGRAFQKDRRAVVLIDEIDKADIDFPNDLLLELDEQRFIVDELDGLEVSAKRPPIIFITSNDEKDLPDAFLRRCLFYYIEFPREAEKAKQELTRIIQAHFPRSPENLVASVIVRFLELREKMESGQSAKKVSTSELIDWFRVLRHYDKDDVLRRLQQELLYPGVLLKSWDDYRQYSDLMRNTIEASEAQRNGDTRD
jgi:MoxR-like ATPase